MKIGILTLPFHTNYGGILQAYALQTVLERMGHEVKVIIELPPRHSSYVMPLVWLKRTYRKWVLHTHTFIFIEYIENKRRQYVDAFVNRYIKQYKVKQISAINESDFDAIVVGSDQIWRPQYYPQITRAYLDFAAGWNIKRLSYAASFGTDVWEYSEEQTNICRELLNRFDVVTTREFEGVNFCSTYFQVSAQQVLDPTMLLDVDDYITLFLVNRLPKSTGDLMYYLLDDSEEKMKLVNNVATYYGLTPFSVHVRTDDESLPLRDRIQPPVEVFLRGFYDSKFIVTDSFHACVFSILFNKPFLAYGNEQRGISRFTSLLSLFGLEDRLIFSLKDVSESLLCKEINWDEVNKTLLLLRSSSMKSLSL